MIFYTALHAVEALFCYDNLEPHTSHTSRNHTLKSYNRYQKIWENYRPLYDAARSTRYDTDAPTWIPLEDVKNELVKYFYAVEKSVLKLMKDEEEELGHIW
ncbi:MAG: hypothetical protein IH830_09300 [Planctomycetes bacterium]|nr:hypothetical protein [Planctomycetota bacterium]